MRLIDFFLDLLNVIVIVILINYNNSNYHTIDKDGRWKGTKEFTNELTNKETYLFCI